MKELKLLARDEKCYGCEAPLKAGDPALPGEIEGEGPGFLCPGCAGNFLDAAEPVDDEP